MIDYVLDHGDLTPQYEANLGIIKITNLERLTESAAVRKILQIDKTDCTVSKKGKKWLVPVWQEILEVIMDEEHLGKLFSVKDIYTAEDQERFIHEILHKVHKVPMPPPKDDGSDKGTGPSGKGGKGGRGKKTAKGGAKGGSRGGSGAPTTRQRKGLIAKNFSPRKLGPQKIVNLVAELKGLPPEKFELSSGVMFRVLMELFIYHYMREAKIRGVDATGRELSEKAKRQEVLKHLKATGKHDPKTFKALEDTIYDNHPVSAQSLNYYVHSRTHSPTASTLKTEWDNLQHIFEIMWEV